MFDLVLKGDGCVDPSTALDGVRDIAVQDGEIARIAPDIPRRRGRARHRGRRQARHARADRSSRAMSSRASTAPG